MSTVIKEIEDREHCHIVQTADGKYYYVDSVDTWDRGYETMAFVCNKNGKVESWGGVYCQHYAPEEEMIAGHEAAINHLEFRINT